MGSKAVKNKYILLFYRVVSHSIYIFIIFFRPFLLPSPSHKGGVRAPYLLNVVFIVLFRTRTRINILEECDSNH